MIMERYLFPWGFSQHFHQVDMNNHRLLCHSEGDPYGFEIVNMLLINVAVSAGATVTADGCSLCISGVSTGSRTFAIYSSPRFWRSVSVTEVHKILLLLCFGNGKEY